MDYKTIQTEFAKWLIDVENLSRKSTYSYRSYINKIYEGYGASKFNAYLNAAETDNDASKKYGEIISFIEGKKAKNRKKWSSIECGFRLFDVFLKDSFAGKQRKEIQYKIDDAKIDDACRNVATPLNLEKNGSKLIDVLSKKTLVRVFKSRLKTQDRYYPQLKLFFPIRLINKIFRLAKSDVFEKWLLSELDEMRLLAETGEFQFKDVKTLSIYKNKKVVISLNDLTQFELYTFKNDGKTRIPFCPESFRDVTIDHIVPIAKIMNSMKNNLPAFQQIAKLYEEGFAASEDTDVRHWMRPFLEKYGDEMKKISNSIMNDLNRMELKYVLMDRRENIRKGKK